MNFIKEMFTDNYNRLLLKYNELQMITNTLRWILRMITGDNRRGIHSITDYYI